MPEPVSLFLTLAGSTAGGLLKNAAERHVDRFFGDQLQKLVDAGKKKSTVAAMEAAWLGCLDVILGQIQALGGYENDDPDFKAFAKALERFSGDRYVAEELLKAVLEPDKIEAPDVAALSAAWIRLDAPDLPEGFTWKAVALTFRKKAVRQRIVRPELRDQLDTENLLALRNAVVGVPPEGDEARYAARMREKYRILDLDALREPTADDVGHILLRDVFIAQTVREDPPPVELPVDLVRRLVKEGAELQDALDSRKLDEHTTHRIELLRESQSTRPAEPALEVLGRPSSTRLVLLGGPGSGKSTLTRYLLLSLLDPPRDPETGNCPSWIDALGGHLPLLLELREFIAVAAEYGCEDFLDYWHHLGTTQKYHVDRLWLDQRLKSGPSLVLFDGLDEIFDGAQRNRILHALAGFAGAYPQARVVVTSRPVGYRGTILRSAGFQHFGIEDLSDEQIEAFIDRWFDLVLATKPDIARERKKRVHEAIRAPSIRLLAGNPMLLTIMALIARSRELPRERWRFYEQAAEVLCHHWDVERHLEDAGLPHYFGLDEKKALLRRIAYTMQSGEGGLAGNVVTEAVLEAEIGRFLLERFEIGKPEALEITRALIQQLRDRNYVLCLRGPKLYGFLHRTFLEYFCATWWVSRLPDPDFKIERIRDEVFEPNWRAPEWREVLRLICATAGSKNAAVLLDYLVDDANPYWWTRGGEDPPSHLILALQCLSDGESPPALEKQALSVVRQVVIISTYRSPAFSRLLADAISGGGWAPQPLPRRARQWLEASLRQAVGSVQSPDLSQPLGELFGSWLAGSTAARVALTAIVREDPGAGPARSCALVALGEGWSFLPEVLDLIRERAIEDPSAWVRGTALETLGRASPASPGTLELFQKRIREEPDAWVRGTALETLGRLGPSSPGALELVREHVTDDPDTAVRGAALETLGRVWPASSGTLELFQKRIREEPDAWVRGMALETLGRVWPASSGTLELVREHVTDDPDTAVRGAALETLGRVWPASSGTLELVRERVTDDPDAEVRGTALDTLGQMWPASPGTLELVRERIKEDSDEWVRQTALAALGRVWPSSSGVFEFVRERAIEDPDAEVRGTALETLGRVWPSSPGVFEFVRERISDDPDTAVRRTALETLGRAWPSSPGVFEFVRELRMSTEIDGDAAISDHAR